jgi:hypothetical protein
LLSSRSVRRIRSSRYEPHDRWDSFNRYSKHVRYKRYDLPLVLAESTDSCAGIEILPPGWHNRYRPQSLPERFDDRAG